MNSIKNAVSKFVLAVFLIAPIFATLPISSAQAAPLNSLIKGSSEAVYWLASNGQRYVFPNARTFYTWFPNFNNVITVSDTELAGIPLGGNVTYRPGAKLIKIESDPNTYAVSRNGILHWVTSEYLASQLYGMNWASQVQDVPVVFFTNYTVGTPIYNVGDVNISNEYNGVSTPSDSLPTVGSTYSNNSGTMSGSISMSLTNRAWSGGSENVTFVATAANLSIPTSNITINIYDATQGNSLLQTCTGATACSVTESFPSAVNRTYYARAFNTLGNYVESNRATFSAGTGSSSSNGTLTASQTSINPGQSTMLSASFPQYGTSGQIEIVQSWDNAVIYTCQTSNTCSMTVYPSISGSTSIQYFARFRSTSNNSVLATAWSPVITVASGSGTTSAVSGMTLSSNNTSINSGDTVRLTAQASNTGYYNYSGSRIEIVDLRTSTIVSTCYNQSWCTPDIAVTRQSGEASAQFYAVLKNASGTELARGYSSSIAFNGTGTTTGSGSVYINGLTLLADQTSIANGTTVRLTANAYSYGSWNYQGNRLEIWDSRNNILVYTCYNQSWCVFNTVPQGTVANPTAQYQVRLYDRAGTFVMSQYGAVIAISGITSDVSSVSGSDRFNGSTSLSAVLTSHTVNNGTETDTISATIVNPYTDIRYVTINLYDANSMALLASCTNSYTCNATLIGTAPLYRSVFARATNQYSQTVESSRIITP